ncbi:hypothetical protein CJ030_MR4G018378 [Morella rubra]|uniref:Uncharacterized protein n=1 Tax=Morella rubra TaxID=262757 RepID=A0A6A1VWU1_9ROSI|nr:hypothetical protein CJ030_MR4G018378 [Morella rubra]
MADGSRLNLLAEAVTIMKEKQENQQKTLNDLLVQLTDLSAGMRALTEEKQLEPARSRGDCSYQNSGDSGGLNPRYLQRQRRFYQRAKDKKIEDQEDARSSKVKIQDYKANNEFLNFMFVGQQLVVKVNWYIEKQFRSKQL